jgi:hypothetical protein
MRIRNGVLGRPAGITLTEILISIMILGVGLVSLATLFPIGLLRLREAQRYTRSSYLFESAVADVTARGLLSPHSFPAADTINYQYNLPVWYPVRGARNIPNGYNPLIQDPGFYGPYWGYDPSNPSPNQGVSAALSGLTGLPFAYDPLWRYVTGIYLDPDNASGQSIPEARFASGIGFVRNDPSDGGVASAHGLPRLTNFSAAMPSSAMIPSIFVSPEDVVWQDSANSTYTVAWNPTVPVGTASPVVPDLSLSFNAAGTPTYQQTNEWRFTWMFTGRQSDASSGSCFDGQIVIFENRPFSLDHVQVNGRTAIQAAGETVVEGVFGFSTNVLPAGGPGYGVGADRTVLLRWRASMADPVVKVGDWIADVTYERRQTFALNRFTGVANPMNKGEWDNQPAQRCIWYQVQKVMPAQQDPSLGRNFRSMVVYVDRKLEARTLLDGSGQPVVLNAALICPSVVNVIPYTFFVR